MKTKDEILDKHFDGFDEDEKLNFIQRELVKNAMEEYERRRLARLLALPLTHDARIGDL